jgi:ubiquinone biosynthesis protein COQ9
MSNDADGGEMDWATATEARLLSAMLAHAPRLGWTSRALGAAARDVGLSTPEAELLAPNGPRDMAALLALRHDADAARLLAEVDPMGLKIRERIRHAVLARCEAAMADQPATHRWAGFLALPPNLPLALRLTWASADRLWRWAGDTATDENHYSKRLLLAEILTSTLAIQLSIDETAARDHLDARIAGVMAFEKWKAGFRPADQAGRIARRLGRLRYARA